LHELGGARDLSGLGMNEPKVPRAFGRHLGETEPSRLLEAFREPSPCPVRLAEEGIGGAEIGEHLCFNSSVADLTN
jgi:hypothetical protein